MHNNEENLETENQETNEIINIKKFECSTHHSFSSDLRNSARLFRLALQSLICDSTSLSDNLLLSLRRPTSYYLNTLTDLKNKFIDFNNENVDIDYIFNRIKSILGIGINSKDIIKSKLKDTINEIIEDDFDCKYDYLKSFLSVILRNLYAYNEKKKFKNIISTFQYMYTFLMSPIRYTILFSNIKVVFEKEDALYDAILYVIDEHDIGLLRDIYLDDHGYLYTNTSFIDNCKELQKLGVLYKEEKVHSIEEIYTLLDGIPGSYLFYDNSRLFSKMLPRNNDKCIGYFCGNKILDNNFNILSKKDRIKCSLFLYLAQFNTVIDTNNFVTLEELACKIESGECSFEFVQENEKIFRNIYSIRDIPSFKPLNPDNFYLNTSYNKFINHVKFYNENELDYDEIRNIYKKLENRNAVIISKNNYNYLSTYEDQRLSHFKGDTFATISENNIEGKFEEVFKEFLIKKFRRSLSDNMLFKVCHHTQFEFDGIEKLKSRFNKTTIKSLRSVKFGNPTIIYMATFYDLSNLNLRTRIYLNYYIDDLNKFNKIKDTTLLKYILKNGNNLSDENLDKILSHINIPRIECLSNIKNIRLHIIKNEMEVEKEKAEREYEFDFEKDSVCELIDNPVEFNGYRMRLLDPKDPKVFIVGKLCDCCYHMNGAAEESMIYSIIMPNSGNIVIEDIVTKEIIATAWVWYDEKNDIYVYDNFEFSDDSLLEFCIDIIEEYSMKLPYKNVHVGLDYNEGMGQYFNKLYGYNEAEFVEAEHEDLDDVYSDYVDESQAVIKSNGNSNRRDPRLI